ncbi:acyl-CoA synthetase [Pollutimonas nitritireducens]|uniref:Long-chain-fatty-acid--CoA ligase n=1 Tax=Pollutimonas nitritireducens TaxID=2045209 RepID=A0A2N4UKI2_9BURK|nr:AMP-binding protein [Pollutimonas nitritireducens]PLC55531.1 acyl-CoA synthetase [Pollutimonas nitritireducens]
MSLITSMPELLAHRAHAGPDDIAFIDGDRRISYRQFADMSRKTAVWLDAQGIGPGDRVAVWLVNRIEWLALYFGLAHVGATLVSVNTRYRSHELNYILERSEARLLVLELNFRKIDFPAVLAGVDTAATQHLKRVAVLNPATGALPDTVIGKPALAFKLDDLPDGSLPARGRADTLSILFTTSGTTSGPKLVMHPQRTLAVHSQRVAKAYGLEEDGACLLATLPLCGVFGFASVLAAFAAGAPVVLMDTFEGAEAARLVNQHKVTHVFGSDEMFQLLIQHGKGEIPFPSARVFGFAAFHPGTDDFGRRAWDRQIPLYGLYGSSEVLALFSLQPRGTPVPQCLMAGGLPASPDARIRIRDTETGELLPAGRSGVIQIHADTNFTGYLNNQEATDKVVDSEGYFTTGDVGYLCEDGRFVYQARQGDALRLGGFLVNPVEIEDALIMQHGVRNAQVVGVDLNGQARCAAFVLAEPGKVLQEQALIDGVAAMLAAFKVPVRVWILDDYPVTQGANGEKIQRGKLREMAMQRLAQEG